MLASVWQRAMLNSNKDMKNLYQRRRGMTTKTFGAMPTPNEAISLDEISKESVDEAWKGYEAKPEYKEFNKHDLIESMHPPKAEQEQQSP
mgnify:FL=1